MYYRKEIEATLELMKKAEHDLNQKQKHLEEWELRLLEKEKKLDRKKKYMVNCYIVICLLDIRFFFHVFVINLLYFQVF